MTKKEATQLEKHLDAIDKAHAFFCTMAFQYDEDNPEGGRLAVTKGPFSDAADKLGEISLIDFE
jgi:hypothetical protein